MTTKGAVEDKAEILAQFVPRAVLRAETEEAALALPGAAVVGRMVAIRRFPFRVGRESRVRIVDGQPQRVERPRLGNREPNNDLYLVDAGEPLQVSREHFLIDVASDGYVLLDRGSACGVSVGDVRVGGRDAGGSAVLRDGDVIAVGIAATPYRYTFISLGTL